MELYFNVFQYILHLKEGSVLIALKYFNGQNQLRTETLPLRILFYFYVCIYFLFYFSSFFIFIVFYCFIFIHFFMFKCMTSLTYGFVFLGFFSFFYLRRFFCLYVCVYLHSFLCLFSWFRNFLSFLSIRRIKKSMWAINFTHTFQLWSVSRLW